jgi:hypothetical protein
LPYGGLVRSIWLVLLAACGGGTAASGSDAAPPDAPPDTANAACRKFELVPAMVPAHVAGVLGGADVEAKSCAVVNAPYGTLTGGPDAVVELGGLAVGATYVVHLSGAADLSFYVLTGCDGQCLLFEDASPTGDETGSFTATGTTAYVVVDTYATTPPADPSFLLDAYAKSCTSDGDCSAGVPACVAGQCVECATSFDCPSASAPVCDATHACKRGVDSCASDDSAEPGDDGPAGATVLVPDGAGHATRSGFICSNPSSEADFIAFDVATAGETWDFALSWTGNHLLTLELYDSRGVAYGLSYWEQPQQARLTYLAPGRYYAVVAEAAPHGDATPVGYTLAAQREGVASCTSSTDCAADYRNQLFRGNCVGGACVSYPVTGATPGLGACDHIADCASGMSCPSFLFVANADTRDVCARTCSDDADCAPLGNYVCTTYLSQNFCVQKCSSDLQCPTSIDTQPRVGPWYRLTCDVASGRCLP